MNSKSLALIAGILAAAFGQIKNVLTGNDGNNGAEEEKPPAVPSKKAGRPAAKPASEPEPEELYQSELLLGGEAAGGVDYDEIRANAKKHVAMLFEKDPDKFKPIVKRLMLATGEGPKIGELSDEAAEVFYNSVKKYK